MPSAASRPLLLTATIALLCTSAGAQCPAPWERLSDNARQIVQPASATLLAGAVVAPALLAPTGADYEVRRFVQTDLGGTYRASSPTVVAPYVTLAGVGVSWVALRALRFCDAQKTPAAMLQGMAWTLGAVALTKWTTGRAWPNAGRDPSAPERLASPQDASDFEPFGRGLAAFPSGHTAIMFAAAAAMRASSPEWGWPRYLGYPLALSVGVGMLYGDHHWTSDVVAGALVGEALGGAAGRAWADDEEPGWQLTVSPLPGGASASLAGGF